MSEPFAVKIGSRFVSDRVYFLDKTGNKIRPIYQLDTDTKKRSYRVYPTSSNKKKDDIDVQCIEELAHFAKKGLAIRCLMPDKTANNVSINTVGIRSLVLNL